MLSFRFVVLTQFYFLLGHQLSVAFKLPGCPAEFQNKCECSFVTSRGARKSTYVTNCTDAGFDNTLMLRKISVLTEVLVFTGNEIRDLPLNIFGQETVYDKLHTIDFSNNHIQTIKGRTFHNVINVTKLILNDNDLYIVSKDHHPRMFSNFIHLKELHLKNAFTEKVKAGDYLSNLAEIFENSSLNQLQILNMEHNEISNIQYDEFCSLPSLEELYLGGNHLRDIAMNFTCLKYLKLLDVGNNFIMRLSDQTLQSLHSIYGLEINLTSNPFNCDCKMVNTYEWMVSTSLSLTNKDDLYCYYGYPPNIGETLMALSPEDLSCIPDLDTDKYHTTLGRTLGIVALIGVIKIVIAVVYVNRIAVTVYLRRGIASIRGKFRYVSLERRDSSIDL